jgi:hypothetical protein
MPQPAATSPTEELDTLGEQQLIFRNHGESNHEYGWRLLYELDVHVEDIWAHQDKIRALIQSETCNSKEQSHD